MPRGCGRRDVLVFTCCTSGLLLLINIFATLKSNNGPRSINRKMMGNISHNHREDWNETTHDDITAKSDKIEEPADVSSRPWYMRGGTLLPMVGGSRGLLPEDSPGEDRITNQLMFLPPNPRQGVKNILVWSGLSSWGGVRPGRGVFLAQECPVNTCSITTTRAKADLADLVLFKDHFFLPSFHRPASQIWMVFMLGKINFAFHTLKLFCKLEIVFLHQQTRTFKSLTKIIYTILLLL